MMKNKKSRRSVKQLKKRFANSDYIHDTRDPSQVLTAGTATEPLVNTLYRVE